MEGIMRILYIYEGLINELDKDELDRVSGLVDHFTKIGADIRRYNLEENPEQFADNKIVKRFLDDGGADVLPIVMVNNEVVITRRYPSESEFYELLFPDSDLDELDDLDGGCGCGSGGTCSC